MLVGDQDDSTTCRISRRRFLGSTAAIALPVMLPGCRWVTRDPQQAPVASIDIHNHVFNGRDVPAVGFLLQVVMRDPHSDVSLPVGSVSFLLLLKRIMLAGTPSAGQELRGFSNSTALRPAAPAIHDEAAVAEGLAALAANDLGSDPTLDRWIRGQGPASLRPAGTAQNHALLETIAADLGAPQLADPNPTAFRLPGAQADALANEIFRRSGDGALRPSAPQASGYVHDTPLIATIRWAGMMTRTRAAIIDQLVALYGSENGIRIYSPSLVDMGRWFATGEDDEVSPISDQIAVISAIARRRQDVLLLPFAPFCPLRAAEELRRDPNADILRNVRDAVGTGGFAGVKLYPPMGFRPLNNRGAVTWAADPNFGDASAFDAPLAALYQWCTANEVPIKAHANNSIAAGVDTGALADPAGWRPVLDRPDWHRLHLNLAHFGGFEESAPRAALTGPDWEDTLIAMIPRYPNLYFDMSYWTEATNGDAAQRRRVLDRMAGLLSAHPQMVERMMCGSDWSMIGREPGHQAYLDGAIRAFRDLGLTETQMQAVMGGNAARYLGLDRPGKQRQRLEAFHAANPIYRKNFMT